MNITGIDVPNMTNLVSDEELSRPGSAYREKSANIDVGRMGEMTQSLFSGGSPPQCSRTWPNVVVMHFATQAGWSTGRGRWGINVGPSIIGTHEDLRLAA